MAIKSPYSGTPLTNLRSRESSSTENNVLDRWYLKLITNSLPNQKMIAGQQVRPRRPDFRLPSINLYHDRHPTGVAVSSVNPIQIHQFRAANGIDRLDHGREHPTTLSVSVGVRVRTYTPLSQTTGAIMTPEQPAWRPPAAHTLGYRSKAPARRITPQTATGNPVVVTPIDPLMYARPVLDRYPGEARTSGAPPIRKWKPTRDDARERAI